MAVLGALENPVFVLGVRDGSRAHGATLAWVAQASYTEPVLSFSLDKRHDTHRALDEGDGTLGLTLLRDDQVAIAEHFGHERVRQMTDPPGFQDRGGAPVLDGAAWLAARVTARADAGTHTVFVARLSAGERGAGVPLRYSTERGYL